MSPWVKCATVTGIQGFSQQRGKKETLKLPTASNNLLLLKNMGVKKHLTLHVGTSELGSKVIKSISKTDEEMHKMIICIKPKKEHI